MIQVTKAAIFQTLLHLKTKLQTFEKLDIFINEGLISGTPDDA